MSCWRGSEILLMWCWGGVVYRDVPVVSEGFLGSCKGNRRVFQGVKAFQEQGFMGSHKGFIVQL